MTQKDKFSFNATWSMAVGGMVGGGIFSVLGVVIERAGQWAWLSFVLAGLIALISAHSYNQLSTRYEKSGGSFTFLNQTNHRDLAASVSWILIFGYILTLSVYAFTFGHYISYILNLGAWLPRVLALVIIGTLTLVNLRGVNNSSKVEIITVWGKLIVLMALALYGLTQWDTSQLTAGVEPKQWTMAIVGAATIFMAYEGFQLLSYDYDDIENPKRNLPKATLSAVIIVIIVYILVSFGATMLVGANKLIQQKEVALAIAGKQAFGITGLIVVTIAAAFSTGSAINATLFSTARLMESVSKENDLPKIFSIENKENIPYYAILIISGIASALAIFGSLSLLVDAASLIFLFTFGIVNYIAFHEKIKYRYISLIGIFGCSGAIVLSINQQIQETPIPLAIIGLIIISAFTIRPFVLNKLKK